MRIAVFGLGYVGCVSAACLAKLGHSVLGIDKDAYKVAEILAGRAPFYEPGLQPLVAEGIANGRLKARTELGRALEDIELALICVGTPSDAEGNLNLEFLRRVCAEIAAAPRSERLIVSIRSTVFPGVNEQILHEEFAYDPRIRMVANPEFLREGSAIRDFLEPSLIVVGGDDPDAVARVSSVYEDLPCPVERCSLRTAEMIKYACNAFHALKIAFANEIGSLCRPMGIDGGEVMRVLCQDRKLNVSPAYLKPGFAFGGSCLPKDLRALEYRASSTGMRLPLLSNVLPSNDEHLRRLVARVNEIPAQRVGIFGLAFKENTDDLRESPVLRLIDGLIDHGRSLRIYDAHIDVTKIYGTNQKFLFEKLPHVQRLMMTTLDDFVAWSDTLVLTQTPSPELAERMKSSGKPMLDLSRLAG